MVSQEKSHIQARSFALLVIDMVNDYLDLDGAMPVTNPEPVIDKTKELVEICRENGGQIVWVSPGHTEEADGLFRKRIPHAIEGGQGSQIHKSLSPFQAEKTVRKRRYSSFFGTDLDMYLREHGVTSVITCGVALNICVRSTVHDAFFNGYDVFVVEDACQATGAREHDSTLYDIETHFGTVLSLEEVAADLNNASKYSRESE